MIKIHLDFFSRGNFCTSEGNLPPGMLAHSRAHAHLQYTVSNNECRPSTRCLLMIAVLTPCKIEINRVIGNHDSCKVLHFETDAQIVRSLNEG